MILLCFTDGVPKDGDRVQCILTEAEKIPDFAPTNREAVKQLIWMYVIKIRLQSSNSDQLPTFTGITDVVFVDVASNKYYESEAQRRIFMEKYGNV